MTMQAAATKRAERAIAFTLANEGVWSEGVCDPGLATKYGISSKYHPGVDVRSLTIEAAKEIYRTRYWKQIYDEIPSETLAVKLFDFAVNAGAERAHKTLQRALNHLTPGGFEVGADGIIGPITMHAIETQDPAVVLAEFIVEMIIFYASRPHWHRFKRGWTRRAIRLPKNGKEGEVA